MYEIYFIPESVNLMDFCKNYGKMETITANEVTVVKYDKGVYRSLTQILQFGINMLVPIFLCTFSGIFLDRFFHTSFLVIILFFVGAVAGGRNVYIFAKQIYEKPPVHDEVKVRKSNFDESKRIGGSRDAVFTDPAEDASVTAKQDMKDTAGFDDEGNA